MTSLRGIKVLVTSGPTHEPLDPVRFLGNRSSGKQGHAIARALQAEGASVTLVSGPVALPDPGGMVVKHVTTAREMLAACKEALPVDVAVCAAAVADWRPRTYSVRKRKKGSARPPAVALVENPDILRSLSRRVRTRPKLVIGFAAETQDVLGNALEKQARKGCDWMLANDVSRGRGFDCERNSVIFLAKNITEPWNNLAKDDIARRLAARIVDYFRDREKP